MAEGTNKIRILVIDSYHPEYLWCKETHRGFTDALQAAEYFDNKKQVQYYLKNDNVETSKVLIKRFWMDTKRKNSISEINKTTSKLVQEIQKFSPSLIALGDDNAANYIGNQFIDTDIPIVFWGVNGTPLKYNLLDSFKRPGHNVTGVYQKGYYKESLLFLQEINPKIKTFAILSDDTTTGRSKSKTIQNQVLKGAINLKLVGATSTSSFENWKAMAKKYNKTADAIFLLNYQGLKLASGRPVSTKEVVAWFSKNITIPDVSDEMQFVERGALATVDDSGYNQGYQAGKLAIDFIKGKKKPESTPPLAPPPGPRVINKKRAKQLKININKNIKIDKVIN
jgi:ABC-type uncharacterized transport system substrate-binding protein